MKKFLAIIFSIYLLTGVLFNSAYAITETPAQGATDNTTQGEDTTLENATFPVNDILKLDGDKQKNKYFDSNNEPIVAFILSVIDFATAIIGTISIILLIVAGFMFMFAQGNQQRLDNAKDIVKYVLIGLIVTFLSYTLAIFVQSIFSTTIATP